MPRDRSRQITHAPDVTLKGWTRCGRVVAGSLELDGVSPTHDVCALLVAQEKRTQGPPSLFGVGPVTQRETSAKPSSDGSDCAGRNVRSVPEIEGGRELGAALRS
jgi:hypothetical protein